MSTAMARRPQTSVPSDGSRTITLRDAQPRPEDDDNRAGSSGEPSTAVGVLKLRGAQRRSRQRVAWGADVIDNEGCGKKKSKICCIYHKPRRFDESSSESESSSASDSELERRSDGRARPTTRYRRGSHTHGCGHNTTQSQGKGGTIHELHHSDSDSDVNAYERAPKRND